MSRKNASTNDDSLDLLLDTICNAFGGILFIALLVLILISLTARNVVEPPIDPEMATKIAAAELKLAQLRGERESAFANSEMLGEMEKQLVDPKSKALAGKLRNVLLESSELAKIRDGALDNLVGKHHESNSLADEISERKQDINRKSNQLAQTNQELEKEIDERSQSANAPETKTTSKSPSILVVKNGKLYVYISPGNYFNGDKVNATDCYVQTDGDLSVLRVKSTGGLTISGKQSLQAIGNRLGVFSNSSYFMDIAVYYDSFDEAVQVKRQVAAMGFDYQIDFWDMDDAITLGPSEDEYEVQSN